MTGIRQRWLLVPIVLSAVALAAPSQAQTTASTERSAPKSSQKRTVAPQSNGHVYLLRGLMNIFSLGMDDLASKIQARGISASVHNHSEWQVLADNIAVQYKARQHGPVVLVGHSLGADAVMYMAEYLGKKGVPVALVVPFDGTGSFAASSNVGQVYNLTQRDYAYMRRGNGFRGQLQNVDVSGQGYGHIDIDKSARLHAMVISRIQGVIRSRGGPRPVDEASPAPRTRPAASPEAPAVKPVSGDAPPAAAPAAPGPNAAVAPQVKPVGVSATAAVSPAAAPATTGSTSESAKPSTVARPQTSETRVRRAPATSENGQKPALRF
ncbi:thioesterase domain-containing protein [Pseudorhodoplanes sp.]|uniref:thioesterase domain-containing protein n=1 Tax=Pseudorhodoplanes sp. TaxID=1934341 RepID=UPI002D187B42|nr:thioesterase domain-containing protein [Pseudorhodoplanes sp.]HWV41268.1 thioesterase domain-containing protein [Pseudorhodoplanes sp.]